MKTFHAGDRVKLSDELLSHPANSHWRGSRGTVTKNLGPYMVSVKWDHIDHEMTEDVRYIERAEE